MRSDEFDHLLAIANTAIGQTPEKWQANTELMTWFRAQPVEVIEALKAAARCIECPGGLNNTRLVDALGRITKWEAA